MRYGGATVILSLLLTPFVYSQVRISQKSTFEGTVKRVVLERPRNTDWLILDTGNKRIRLANVGTEYAGRKVAVEGAIQADGTLSAEKIVPLTRATSTLDFPVSGTRSVLVLVLNFQNQTSQPVSVAEIKSRLFTREKSPGKYYEQVSNGRYRLGGRMNADGDVIGYLTLPLSNENCTFDAYDNLYPMAANQLAANQGINVSQYQTRIYLFPTPVPLCDFTYAELGVVGDTTTSHRIMVSDWNYPAFDPFGAEYTVTHEMGHNIGLQHASGYQNCPSDVPFESCSGYEEYADRVDLMGFFGYYQLNNYNRARLGWLNGETRTFDAPGTYTLNLAAPGHPAKRPTAAKIRLKNANGDFTGNAIFLEFRRNMPPFDIFVPTLPPFPIPGPQLAREGVTIRFGAENLSDANSRSLLIDTTSMTSDYSDAQLLVGQTFANTYYGISITTLSVHPGSGASVRLVLTR